jgi:hypothetical protein
MLYWVAAAAVLILCAWALSAFAAEAAPSEKGEAAVAAEAKVYDPANTKVAVLPFVNALGKDSPEHKAACERAVGQLRKAFDSRAFQVLSDQVVADAVKKLGLDLSDSEGRSKETFQKVGDEVGANLVVCGILMNYKSYMGGGFFRRKHGAAKIELKVYDANDKVYAVRTVQQGTSRGDAAMAVIISPALEKSRGLREAALDSAIENALKDFVKPYPVTKKKEGGSSSG